MKKTIITLGLALACLCAKAQNLTNVVVLAFWNGSNLVALGNLTNTQTMYIGAQSNALSEIFAMGMQTAVESSPNAISAIAAALATNAAFNLELLTNNSNPLVSSNYAAWYSMYTNIPAGIADSQNRINTLSNDWNSYKSGTNTIVGTNTLVAQLFNETEYSYVYLNQIITYLSRLGPGLSQIYTPQSDPVGQ